MDWRNADSSLFFEALWMSERKSLKLPIVLAVVMIVLLLALIFGWVVLTVPSDEDQRPGLYWAALAVGTTFLALILIGVVLYLSLSIKAINLTRRQSNFIDSVTHELKSPIASLKLYLQTLSRRQVSHEQRQRFCDTMLEDVDRLNQLINHILDAGRLEKSPSEIEYEEVALDDLLVQCAQSVCLRFRVPESTVELSLEPCRMVAPRVDLDIIFRNLLDNAVKYAGAEPRVVVVLRRDETGDANISIRDNGRGIPAKLRRKIFGRFVRLGHELVREKPGTGLGLYIVRTLVRRLRGRIDVADAEEGPGTVFKVRLPGSLAASLDPAAEQIERATEAEAV